MDKDTQLIKESTDRTLTEPCIAPTNDQASESTQRNQPTPSVLDDAIYDVEQLERIGGGGYGEVWRVRYLGSEEAWKYIPIRSGSSERTGREAIHSRRVNHKNVVRVLDVLRLPDHYVLRMELVKGRDFSRVVQDDGVIPPQDAAAYGLQVAQALAYAHSQGVAHLDLKPHNLILCEDGARVMLTDFGISASLARDPESPEAVGTPYFMAPEQFDTPPAVACSIDIWSLAVTLYWMMSLSYPFKFDERDPREVIRNDSPIPLSEVMPYVPDSLSRILEGLLKKDPAARPVSMDAVVKDLEAFQKNPGHPTARRGDRAFALCQFDEAIACYRKVDQKPSAQKEEFKRAQRLLSAAQESEAEHQVQLVRIDERIAEDDLAGALLAIGITWRRFSRSTPLKERRMKIEEELRQRFSSPRRMIENLLRSAQFSQTKTYLDKLSSLIGIPGARKLLRDVAGQEAVIDGAAIQRFRSSVQERETLYQKLLSQVEEAVQAMDFARARDAMEELQNHFPLPENLEKMKAFTAAAEALAFLSRYPMKLLEKVIDKKVQPTVDQPFFFRKAAERCNELLRDFDLKTYRRFSSIQTQADLLQKAMRSLRERAEPEVEIIRDAHERGDTRQVRRRLKGVENIILHTDIFPEEVRDSIREIRNHLNQSLQRADRLYNEGRGWMECCQFNKALTAFEEALRIGGGHHDDLRFLMRTCSEAAERRRRLNEDLHSLDLTISAQAARLPEIRVYLKKAEELISLQEDSKKRDTVDRFGRVLTIALELSVVKASQGTGEERIGVLRELSSILSGIKPEFLATAARNAAFLPEKLKELVQAVLGPKTMLEGAGDGESRKPGTGKKLDHSLVFFRSLVKNLNGLAPLLAMPPAGGSPHPSEIVAGELFEAASELRKEGAGIPGQDILSLLDELAGLSPSEVSEGIKVKKRAVLWSLWRRRVTNWLFSFFGRTAKFMIPLFLSLALSGVVVLAWYGKEHENRKRHLSTALSLLKRDHRWAKVGSLTSVPRTEFALAMRMIERDLPAFSALKKVGDPDPRFWARCVSGAGILASIAREETPVLGRTGIRNAVEEALRDDLEGAVEAWIKEASRPFPLEGSGRGGGFPALYLRLEIADRVLGSLGRLDIDPEKLGGLAAVRRRIWELRDAAGKMKGLVERALQLAVDLGRGSKGSGGRAADSFWIEFLSCRRGAPSEAWKRLLDSETAAAFVDGMRKRPFWEPSLGSHKINRDSGYELIRLIARIRELSGSFTLVDGWSEMNDPLHPILYPLVR